MKTQRKKIIPILNFFNNEYDLFFKNKSTIIIDIIIKKNNIKGKFGKTYRKLFIRFQKHL